MSTNSCPNKSPEISKEVIQSLKDRIPWGRMQEIAEEVGLSRTQVWRILEAGKYNKKVIICASRIIKEHEDGMAEAKKALEKIQ